MKTSHPSLFRRFRLEFILMILACVVLFGGSSYLSNYTEVNRLVWRSVHPAPIFSPEEFPKVDGSTATEPFVEAVASAMMALPKGQVEEKITHHKTHEAYVKLINKEVDVIFVSQPSDDELALAKENGVELDVQPILKEAFVFFVNKKNPVNSLTTEQIQNIYSGVFTNWKAVGGKDQEIVAYQRNQNSGSQTVMEKVFMKGLTIKSAPTKEVSSMVGMVDVVAEYENAENAIGYSFNYFATTMYRKGSIKLLAVDGVAPTKETILSDQYPVIVNGYLVTRKGDVTENTQTMIEWLKTDAGKKAVEEGGFVTVE